MDKISHRDFFSICCYILIASVVFSKFMLSVATFALIFLSIVRVEYQGGFRFTYNQLFFDSIRSLFKHPAFLAVSAILILNIISGINSSDKMEWLHHLKLKLPFLAFPIIFLNHNWLDKKLYQSLFLALIAIAVISGIFVLLNYASDYEAITYAIGSGHSIPTPISHTRYSTLLALSILACILLYKSDTIFQIKHYKKLIIFSGVFLFVLVHVLAVRSGLLALYFGLFIIVSILCLRAKKYLVLGLFYFLICLGPIVAYNTVTSFYNKVHYTMYDLKMHKAGSGQDYSDSNRITSLQVGLEIVQDNFLFGTGIGDLRRTVHDIYTNKLKREILSLPHNQFLYIAAAMGILGGVLYLICFFFPLFYHRNYEDLLMLSVFIVLSILCMVEKPLERSTFISFYSFFVCAGISYNLHIKSIDKSKQ